MTPLHWAVKRNYLTMAEMLLKKGAHKNAQDILGRTCLHLAAKLNYFEMTKVITHLILIHFSYCSGIMSTYT